MGEATENEGTETVEANADIEAGADGTVTRGHALADARGVLYQDLTSDAELTTKAWRSVQFSGLSATIFAGLVAPHFTNGRFNRYAVVALLAAAILLATSMFIGFRQQDSTEISTGPETKYYRAIADHDYDTDEYVKKALKLYADSIDEINEEIENKALNVKISLITSVAGVIFLIIAIIFIFA